MRRLPVVETTSRVVIALAAIVVLGLPFVLAPQQVNVFSVIFVFMIIGLSLLVLTGWAGQISLGQFAFAAVGGYVAVQLGAGLGLFFLLALLGGGLAGAVVAVLVGLPALRLRGLYLAVTTLAFALATTSILLNGAYLGRFLPSGLTRPVLLGLDLENESVFYYVCLLFVVLTVAALAGLRRSRTARALIACRDNEQAGQSFGISLMRARLEAFAISGFIAAVGGGLFAYAEHGVDASLFAPEQSLNVFSQVIIGGLGSVLGPVLGSLYGGLFRLFPNALVQLLGTGFGVLFILFVAPSGLSGIFFASRDAWLRRVAVRYRMIVPSLLADVRADALAGEAPIAPRSEQGGSDFVPVRYRLEGQWESLTAEAADG
jgi:branched-chain amino acid transport system permease protein